MKGFRTLGAFLAACERRGDLKRVTREVDWAHQYLDSGRVDGFILLTASRKSAYIKNLVEMGAPFIAWGVANPTQNYSTVNGDNISGGRIGMQHAPVRMPARTRTC